MSAIPVVINRCAAMLVPNATVEGQAFLQGVIKVIARYGPGGKAFARDTAMFLTGAEQSAIFRFGVRGLVKLGSGLFLVGAILDTVRNLISPGEERRSIATRLEMIESQVIKGGPLWTRAISIGEQLLFIALDIAGETMADAAAGIVANFDAPGPPSSLNVFDNGAYRDLATPVSSVRGFDFDSEFTAPGFLLQPQVLPFSDQGGLTFPAGPRPSWGRRS